MSTSLNFNANYKDSWNPYGIVKTIDSIEVIVKFKNCHRDKLMSDFVNFMQESGFTQACLKDGYVSILLKNESDKEKVIELYEEWKSQNTIMPKIKPCPFCGGKAELIIFNQEYGTVTIGCTNEECDITMGKAFFAEDEAIEHWNRRAKISD